MEVSKVFALFLIMSFAMLVLFDVPSAEAAANERPQRRRRPFPTEVDADGTPIASPAASRFLFPNQRRSSKVSQTAASTINNNKALQSDIAESCKSEPGCEWSCEDVNECMCRCKFDPLMANTRSIVSRESRLTPR